MHSRRIHTAHSSGHPGGVSTLPGSRPPQSRHPPDQTPPGSRHLRQSRADTPQSRPSGPDTPQTPEQTPGPDTPGSRHPPTVNRITDTCKNITVPQTSFAGGNNAMQILITFVVVLCFLLL